MTFFKKIYSLFNNKDKKYILFLLFFSVFVSIIELMGLSATMPFISSATDFSMIDNNLYLSYIYKELNFNTHESFIMFFGLVLILFYIFRGLINVTFFYLLSSFTQNSYHRWASDILMIYLKMPYKYFIQKNQSILIKVITTEVQNMVNIITSTFMIISELFILILIYSFMIWVNFEITIFLTIFLIFNAFLMLKYISPKIKEAGVNREKYQEDFYEIVNKSLRNYKIIKLHSLNNKIYNDFCDVSLKFKKVNIINVTLSNLPRLFLESTSFSLLILIIVYLVWTDSSNISDMMAKITFFFLSLYRLMPSISRILYGYNQIMFYHKALDIIDYNYTIPLEKLTNLNIEFKKDIRFSNISFRYSNDEIILKDINLVIKKYQKIAFIGESGSGKSTLINLIIGLFEQTKGDIYVDDKLLTSENIKNWRSKIGYIPQEPYLFTGTLLENIIFGSEYNHDKVINCLKDANIYNFFMGNKGLKTLIGENGINLSGGQKQRIAIARALYNDPDILVLDEATSALDYDMERKIMSSVYEICKDKTLIIIAHRLNTIKNCDVIYKLTNGVLIQE